MRRALLQLGGGGAFSKALGVVRELLLARYFGTGAVADAFRASHTLAFNPTHLFTRLIQAALVPLYARRGRDDPAAAAALFRAVLILFGGLGLLVAVLLFVFALPVVRLVLPGFGPERVELAAGMLRIVAAGVPFYVYCNLLGALGAAQDHYVLPSLRPAVQNVGMIVAIAAAAMLGRPLLAAWGFTGAYALYAVWATALLARSGLLPASRGGDHRLVRALLGELWALMRPLVLLTALVQGAILVERYVASLLGPGNVAGLDYARFLSETAHALVAMPLGLTSLAYFARLDPARVGEKADELLALLSLSFVPLSIFVVLQREALVAAIFLRGAFDADSARITASALLGLGAGLWLFSGSYLLQRIFNARLRNRDVLWAEGLGVFVTVAFDLLLYRRLGIAVIGFGVAAGAACSSAWYLARLRPPLRLLGRCLALLAVGAAIYLPAALALRAAPLPPLGGLALQLLLAALFWGALPFADPTLRGVIRARLRRG